MEQIIDISDELFSIFKKHGIMAFDYLNEYDKDNLARIIANGIPYNPKGDLISREALKEKIDKKALDLANGGMIFVESINHIIDNVPPLPQVTVFTENADEKAVADLKSELQNVIEARPKGEWVFKHNSSDIWCSVCDENFDEIPQAFNFCPNCGADMRKGGAEE